MFLQDVCREAHKSAWEPRISGRHACFFPTFLVHLPIYPSTQLLPCAAQHIHKERRAEATGEESQPPSWWHQRVRCKCARPHQPHQAPATTRPPAPRDRSRRLPLHPTGPRWSHGKRPCAAQPPTVTLPLAAIISSKPGQSPAWQGC